MATTCQPGHGRGRTAGRGQRQPAMRSLDINKLTRETHVVGAVDLQDVAYHLGLCTDGKLVGGCVRDFQQWYGRSTWGMVEELLGARPPMRGGGKNEYAAIKMTWLRDRLRHTPAAGEPDVLKQFARCYIMLMIGCWLFPNKSVNMVSVRWLPLIEDFESCKKLS
ncbi:hypothetical protein PIB30_003765 [Stylosanthes scabra]|uniref:Aminotransferase-like plant mobile domain-containing protein n=1 Tax=Stylosanthes scabra TaxID=79078 RepID=A0ABU6R5N0_9FABA|nr:hypothetical protein [Stylosanthes scabra]